MIFHTKYAVEYVGAESRTFKIWSLMKFEQSDRIRFVSRYNVAFRKHYSPPQIGVHQVVVNLF